MTAYIGHAERSLLAALVLLATSAHPSQTCAADTKVPPQFIGVWGTPLNRVCRSAGFPDEGSLLVKIDADGIKGTEFGCKARAVNPARTGTWFLRLDCSGEGLEVKTAELWQRLQIGTAAYMVRAIFSDLDRAIEVYRKCG